MKEQLGKGQEGEGGEFLLPEQFREFRQALSQIYAARPESRAHKFAKPSHLSRQAHAHFLSEKPVPSEFAQYYYPDVPSPVDITELSDETIGELFGVFGPDFMRAKMVSPAVLKHMQGTLPVGGACLIETWGLDLLNKSEVCKNQDVRAQTVQRLIDNSPYYTQITGTMLMGGSAGVGLMYREEYPWHLRAAELGLNDAEKQTHETYDKMVAAQNRRGALIDPAFFLLTLPFDKLRLEDEGFLKEWFDLAMPHLPRGFTQRMHRYQADQYLTSWVRYTYSGPRILDVVKARLLERGVSLEQFSLHVRTKQLDHLGGPTSLLRDFGKIDFEELQKLQKYQSMFGMAIDGWLARFGDAGQTGFVGFDDLSVEGDILHQTVNVGQDARANGKSARLPETNDELNQVLASCARLNSNNVDAHFAYLDFCAVSESAPILGVKEVVKRQRAVASIAQSMQKMERDFVILQRLMSEGSEPLDQACFDFFSTRAKVLAKAQEVVKTLRRMGIDDDDQKRKVMLSALISQSGDMFASLVSVLGRERDAMAKNLRRQKELLARQEQELDDFICGVGENILQKGGEVVRFPKTSVLPLSDNMLVSHAVQLSFDPDMRSFVFDVVGIAQRMIGEQEKKELIMQCMQAILPKMKQYLRFIMNGGEYPQDRFKQTYQFTKS